MSPTDEPSADGPPGLRERKKRQTRLALSRAAIRLCVLHGWAEVTIERIAAEADVSVRTFRNYFAGKAEAIAHSHLERMTGVAEDLLARPADEPLWEALRHAVLGRFAPPDSVPQDPRWREGVRLMLTEPALAGEIVKAGAAAERTLAAAVARRTGTDPDHELHPKLVAAVVAASSTVAVEHGLRSASVEPLDTVLTRVFEQLAAGLPVPQPGPHGPRPTEETRP
ncbi:TetR family transcriptional regulator [Streptomyces sp. NPDC049906]|uniref:acyl-CoA-like ligand-binding transcription factor n=1 Tax=Streptomyces sp. NPDC049906 TaxID=3155656 RepID=UPI003421A85E